ncbi:DUF3093 domain-containing protein [Isoptericola dokdonensis]|jgi:hypothetical protein|uniref:DUF3093 domain-containing protein n=1 Tax=Isoptericola dokdonensis DS-3 TaxID=1300344 RepID=A0A161I602_9MICO|nr:DUF3093 domain-containing protein [Isoptericola dokdonensis]ANC30018.1 hypothetical protein I598_0431 [Isoptericola dokdonensis DS-3]
MNDVSARPGHAHEPSAPAFRERLLPGPGAWLVALGLGVIAAVVVLPLQPLMAPGVGVLVAAATVAVLIATSPLVEVDDGLLRAGPARVPVALLGTVTPIFSAEEMRLALGPDLDARAYVCLRTWARTGLRVELRDPLDPAPYWLVSTRRPDELAEALSAAGAGR